MIRKFKNITPTLGKNVYVDEQAGVIGDVVLGDDCSVWPMAILRGDVNKIRVGDRSNIQDGTVVHVTHGYSAVPEGYGVSIGNDVTIGHNSLSSAITDDTERSPSTLTGAHSLIASSSVMDSREGSLPSLRAWSIRYRHR